MARAIVEMTLENRPELVPGAASYIAGFMETGERERNLACYAIEDMLEYRLSQLQPFDPTVRIEVFGEPASYCVRISDRGLPYALDGMRKKALENGLCERYEMTQHGSGGQSVSLYFLRSGEQREFSAPAAEEETLLDTEFSCRLLDGSEDDMLEAIKCLYSAYGFDYLHEELYFYDSFRRKLESGRYITILCENAHHQVVGHCALSDGEMLPGIPEFCCLVTKPFARGNGIADMLLSFAEQTAESAGYEGVIIYPVVYHPYTQKISDRHGYLPAAMHPSMATPAQRGLIYRQGDLRGGEVISAKLFKKHPHTVFLPAEYEEYAAGVFGRFGLKYTVARSAERRAPGVSVYTTSLQPNTRTAFIRIDEAGEDLDDLVDGFIKSGLLSGTEMIGLYVNINVPAKDGMYELFRRHGFVFSGVIPGSTAGDFIYMQWFRTPYPLETMVLEPSFGEMIDSLRRINGSL